MLIVQKYGGSSLATPDHIKDAAERIAELHRQGHRLLIVVSAMGKTTDQLVALADQVSSSPLRRELDMLLSTGERVSMALMSMALNDRGCEAISFTGSQAGVLTDEAHSNARIIDIRAARLEAEVNRGRIVVLAGFQGVSPVTKEITTLGRGGSDTTAVAMAAHFKAARCEIRKDVEGVFSADPRVVRQPKHLSHLSFAHMLEMTFWGAKVLHYRSVELAAKLNIPIVIGLAHGEGRETRIDGGSPMFEQEQILSVNSHTTVYSIRIQANDAAQALQVFGDALSSSQLPWPQILDLTIERLGSDRKANLLVTSAQENLEAIAKLFEKNPAVEIIDRGLATVSATCSGAHSSEMTARLCTALKTAKIEAVKVMSSSMTLSFVVIGKDREPTIRILHEFIR